MGRRHGEVLGPVLRKTLEPYLAAMYRTPERLAAARACAARLEPAISDDHRAEMRALAAAAGVSYESVVLANCSADICVALACSTVCASGPATGGGPLVVGRNLDFIGYGILDGYSLLIVFRPAGKHAFAAPSWPGLIGIQSGMNDRGVCVDDMVDIGAAAPASGKPYSFLMREMLERAQDDAPAIAIARDAPHAVSHNLFVCDERRAAVLEVGPGRFALRRAEDGLLFSTNNFVSKPGGGPAEQDRECPRYRCLERLARDRAGKIDAEAARELIASTSITFINLQAMVFVPAERLLLFGRGTTLSRATDGPFSSVRLASALAPGRRAEEVEVTPLAPVAGPPARYRSLGEEIVGAFRRRMTKPVRLPADSATNSANQKENTHG
jgi:hypothetical protein